MKGGKNNKNDIGGRNAGKSTDRNNRKKTRDSDDEEDDSDIKSKY